MRTLIAFVTGAAAALSGSYALNHNRSDGTNPSASLAPPECPYEERLARIESQLGLMMGAQTDETAAPSIQLSIEPVARGQRQGVRDSQEQLSLALAERSQIADTFRAEIGSRFNRDVMPVHDRSDVERAIYASVLESDSDRQVSLHGVDCRESLCRISYELADVPFREEQFELRLPMALASNLGDGLVIYHGEEVDGMQTLYLEVE
jgi:hypothetical protein